MKIRHWVWLWAFSKRLLQKRFFLCLLCMFPLCSIGIFYYSQSETPLVQVALFNESGSELGEQTIQRLIKENTAVHFYETRSVEELYRDVQRTKAECGYILTKDYQMETILEPPRWREAIHVAESPGSMLTGSVNELVFSAFFQIYTEKLVLNYIRQPNVLEPGQNIEDIVHEAEESYEEYCQARGIFIVGNRSDLDKTEQATLIRQAHNIRNVFLSNMCRGILSVLILLAAMSGTFYLLQDQKTGLLLPLSVSRRPVMEFLEILAPSLLMGISGMAGLVVLPASQPLWKEAAGLILYIPMSAITAFIMVRIIHMETLFRALLPLLALGALLFPPVFLDASVYAKILAFPKYLFINSYYLEMITGDRKDFLIMLSVLGILLVLLLAISKKQTMIKNRA
ncbi:MAG: hypothetical protein HFI75_09515 [Lachnospiraceae bacterium]|nr:hypothetical protein [Lachnospiraceae bacterium]